MQMNAENNAPKKCAIGSQAQKLAAEREKRSNFVIFFVFRLKSQLITRVKKQTFYSLIHLSSIQRLIRDFELEGNI